MARLIFPGIFFLLLSAWIAAFGSGWAEDIQIQPDFSLLVDGKRIHLFGIKPPPADSDDFFQAMAALNGLLAGGDVACQPIDGHDDRICKIGGSDIAEELLSLGLVQPVAAGIAGSDADLLSQHYLSIYRESAPALKSPAIKNENWRSLVGPWDWRNQRLWLTGGILLLLLCFGVLARLIWRRRLHRKARTETAMILVRATALRDLAQDQLLALEGVAEDDDVPLSRIHLSTIPPILLQIGKPQKFVDIMLSAHQEERRLLREYRKLARLLVATHPPKLKELQAALAHLSQSAEALTERIERRIRQSGPIEPKL